LIVLEVWFVRAHYQLFGMYALYKLMFYLLTYPSQTKVSLKETSCDYRNVSPWRPGRRMFWRFFACLW